MSDPKNQAEATPVTPEAPPKSDTAAKPAAAKSKGSKPEPKPKLEPKPVEATVLLKDIILPSDWNREKLTNITELARSIKDIGLINPLVVYPSPDKPGKVVLNDGRRRYAALQEAGVTRVPVYVKMDIQDDTQAFLISLVSNLNREENTDYEVAVALKKLSETMKHKDIARALGKSEGFVSQHISATNVPEPVLKGFRKGEISFAKIRVFARLKEEEDATQIEKILAMALDPNKTTDDMNSSVDMYLEKKHKKEGGKKKKGSAAKTKAEKKRGPAPKIMDYDDPEVRKLINIVSSKEKAVALLNYAKERRVKSSSAKRVSYFDGMMDGMELFAGLKIFE